MVGIVDIYGTVEHVEIRPGVKLEFIGWSGRAFGSLLRRFPFIMDTFNAKPLTLKDLAELHRCRPWVRELSCCARASYQ